MSLAILAAGLIPVSVPGAVAAAKNGYKHQPINAEDTFPEHYESWGALAYLPGHYWTTVAQDRDEPPITQYFWREPGRILGRRSGIQLTLWTLKPDGSLSLTDGEGKALSDDWKVNPDGSVVFPQKSGEGAWTRTYRASAPDRIEISARKSGENRSYAPEIMNRLTDDRAPTSIERGTFDSEDYSEIVAIRQEGSEIFISNRYGPATYRRADDGIFHSTKSAYGAVRILGDNAVEYYIPSQPMIRPMAYIRRVEGGRSTTEPMDGFYAYENPDPRWKVDGLVLKRDGDILYVATDNSVSEYRKAADGNFYAVLNPEYVIRSLDIYSIEITTPLDGGKSYTLVRRNDATDDYIQVARQNQERENRRIDAENDRLLAIRMDEMAAAEEEREAEREAALGSEPSTNSMGILGGFMKGLAEATASNNAMEQSMRDAANSGRMSVPEQHRSQNSQDVSGGLTIEEQREESYPPAPTTTGGTQMQFYAWCFAMESPNIIFSPIQAITVETPWSTGPMADAFGAAVGSTNATCQTERDQATAEARMDEMIAAWPQRTPVHMQVALTP